MTKNRQGLVVLMTDFGTRDWYVATLKAVILARCPSARLIDITHEIPPQDTMAGAFTLAAATPWFPIGTVFVAVVDPGVGTQRALMAARADGRYFVGPDNGLLALSLQQAQRVTLVRLTNRRYWLKDISQTFHGRDILAPVAAHLVRGGSFTALGVPMRRASPLHFPRIERTGHRVDGRVVHIDAFGNLITSLPVALLPRGSGTSRRMLRYKHHVARVVSSYAAGRAHELVAVAGSLGFIELAVRNGSAARAFGARRGDVVRLAT